MSKEGRNGGREGNGGGAGLGARSARGGLGEDEEEETELGRGWHGSRSSSGQCILVLRASTQTLTFAPGPI